MGRKRADSFGLGPVLATSQLYDSVFDFGFQRFRPKLTTDFFLEIMTVSGVGSRQNLSVAHQFCYSVNILSDMSDVSLSRFTTKGCLYIYIYIYIICKRIVYR